MLEYYELPVLERQVDIIHILNDGHIIISVQEFEPYQNRFSLIDAGEVRRVVRGIRSLTDSSRKSIVTIFENGEIKQYPNVSKNFTDYTLLNKSGL